MIRRFLTFVGSGVIPILFAAWWLVKIILDYAGRADILSTLGQSTNIFERAAGRMLATPWQVPAVFAGMLTLGWLYLAYRLMEPAFRSAQIQSVNFARVNAHRVSAAVTLPKDKAAPTFTKTVTSDHALNVPELVNQTNIADIQKKIDALDYLAISYEAFVSLSIDVKHFSLGGDVSRSVERAKTAIQDMYGFKVNLQVAFNKTSASSDVVACFTVWGFEETVRALNELVTVAEKAKDLPPEPLQSIVQPYLDNAKLAARSFDKWREETGNNINEFRSCLNRRLLQLSNS